MSGRVRLMSGPIAPRRTHPEKPTLDGSDSIAATKRTLRRDFVARRTAMDDDVRRDASKRALLNLVGALPLEPSSVVAAFWPMRGEVDTRPLFEALAALRIVTALPRVVGKAEALAFHRFRPGDALLEGRLRVFEPAPSAPRVLPTIVVVPMVAFDAAGYRLGYGGGFYDRTLAGLPPGHVAIGLALEVQRASALPYVATDVRLSTIVTETGVHHFPG